MDVVLEGMEWDEKHLDAVKRWLNINLRVDPERIHQFIDQRLPEAREKKDKIGAAWLCMYKAWLYVDINDHEKAYPLFESARADFEALDDKEGYARTLNGIAVSNTYQGLYDLAIDLYREAMKVAIEMGRLDIASAAGCNLARCLLQCDEEVAAVETLEHCRRHFQVASHNTIPLCDLEGEAYRKLGRLEDSERSLLQGLALSKDSPNLSLDVRHQLAETYLDGNRISCAETLIQEALRDAETFCHWKAWASLKLSESRLLLLKGEPRGAIESAKEALLRAKIQGSRREEALGERLLYEAWLECKEYKEALNAFERHASIVEALRKEQTTRRIVGLNSERLRREALHFETLYKQVSAISEIGQRIASSLDLDESFEVICEAISGLMDVSAVLLALVNEKDQTLEFRYILDQRVRLEPVTKGLNEKYFGCWCVNNRQDIVIHDLEAEYRRYLPDVHRFPFEQEPESSLIYIPLFLGDKVVGALSVQSRLRHAYDPQKVEILRAVGGYIAIVIENSRLFQEVQHLASTDALTGLANRRSLMEEMERVFQQTMETKEVTGVIAMDLDHFKKVNDTFGHHGGDVALTALGQILSQEVQDKGMVGRFGGEEFLVVLPGFKEKETLLVAEELRQAVSHLRIPLPDGTLQMTASFGVSFMSDQDSNCQDSIKRADKALYEAKGTGRNRVCTRFL